MRVAGIASFANAFKEALLPALCIACDGVLSGGERGLCGACRSRMVPMSEPCCPRCGVPSDSETDPCITCVDRRPPQDGTIVWGSYEGILRRAVLALKHAGHDELARPLGRRLAARVELAPWSAEITAVAAVPSHGARRLRRGTCAAELLGAAVAAAIRRPSITALRRHGFGRQAGRTRSQRRRLARGSFSARRALAGHRILLVDDVTTTGTTLRRASETIKEAGAEAVYCAALAITPEPRRV